MEWAADHKLLLAAAAGGMGGLYLLTRRRTSDDHVQSTSFDAYMRNKEFGKAAAQPKYAATSFEAYLRAPAAAAPAAVAAHPAAGGAAGAAPLDAKPLLVLYGTEFGFSKEVAEKLGERLRGAGYWPQLVDMADHPRGMALGQHQGLLVVCSTQGDGVPPTEAREFCDWLGSGAAPALDGLPFAVCALGDRSYQHFARCGRNLDARLEALGGSRCAPRVDVNKEDWRAVDGWVESALAGLAGLDLRTLGELGGEAALPPDAPDAEASERRWGRARPYVGAVVALEGLCTLASADDKNTWRVEIDLGDSGLEYQPGDALGVVEDLLAELGADGGLLVRLPSWHYADAALGDLAGPPATIALRQALARCYDLRQPKQELLALLLRKLQEQAAAAGAAAVAGGAGPVGLSGGGLPGKKRAAASGGLKAPAAANGHVQHEVAATGSAAVAHAGGLCAGGCLVDKIERLAALTADVAAAEAYLEPRHVLEHPARVQATVAVVRYESLGRGRLGVASTYLCERLAVGQAVPVYISKNPDFRLPADPATPIVMERILASQTSGKPFGESLLFFGCRRRDQDYLYGPLLEHWAAEGHITLRTAFSREQAHKVYVQQRLAEEGDRVWGLLQAGAHFYVCGDAANMAGQVEEALLGIVQARQGGDRTEALAYLERLAADHRYERDVWF
eukprot:scaffold7.g3434.t1